MSLYSTVQAVPAPRGGETGRVVFRNMAGPPMTIPLPDGQNIRVDGLILAAPARPGEELVFGTPVVPATARDDAVKPFAAKVAEYFPSETVVAYTILQFFAPAGEQGARIVALFCLGLNVVLFGAYLYRRGTGWQAKGVWPQLGLSCLAYAGWAVMLHGDRLLPGFAAAPGLEGWVRFAVLAVLISACLLVFILHGGKKVMPQEPKR